VDDKSDLAFIRDTLRQEAMALLDQQHAITDKGGRALALGGTVLAAFAAYGIAGKAPGHELLLRALPAALALIAIELLQNFATEASIAKVREHIEEAFSEHFDGGEEQPS
jgi:Na+/H+ antiporter NhaD/arsenite permease-like protein